VFAPPGSRTVNTEPLPGSLAIRNTRYTTGTNAFMALKWLP